VQRTLQLEHERDGGERVAAVVEEIVLGCANRHASTSFQMRATVCET
jgi:hypothetical protein